ncbi:MAG: DUF2007 domain-containing protein [Prevotellaceae bacterium]|jgi:phosphorylcholine metabolism protein LicD|nr:DUF2007 domain-containing protein [Prevotellaceae bacterium]
MDNSRTAVLMVLHSVPQAKIIKGLLEANNIQCFLSTETMPSFGTFFSDDDGIKLYVLEKDYREAKELLMGT